MSGKATLSHAAPALTLAWHGVEDGRIGEPAPAAHPRGTTVAVRDLFYNTPARRRFMRTERTEFGHIEKVARRLALSRFDVAFRLVHDGRLVFDLRPAATPEARLRRIAEVCGEAAARPTSSSFSSTAA